MRSPKYRFSSNRKRTTKRASGPAVELELEGRVLKGGCLFALNPEGAEVHFSLDEAPSIPLRSDAWLRVRSGPSSFRVPALVVQRCELEDGRQYGLWFDDPEMVEREVLPSVGPLLDRRSAPRVPAPPDEPVEIVLEDANGARAVGVLVDVSVDGLAVRLDPYSSDPLCETCEVEARFRFREWDEELQLCASIRHREIDGGRVRYGLAFQHERSDPGTAAVAVEVLGEYVRRRQREALRHELSRRS